MEPVSRHGGAGHLGEVNIEYIRPPDRHHVLPARLLAIDDRHMVTTHEAHPSKPLVVAGEEVIGDGYRAVWFLYKGESYDVGRFYRPDGTWTGYYLDVLEPVHWDGDDSSTLRPIVDLFLDIWIGRDGEMKILDEDEFSEAVRAGHVSTEQEREAVETLQDLSKAIEAGLLPASEVKDFRLV